MNTIETGGSIAEDLTQEGLRNIHNHFCRLSTTGNVAIKRYGLYHFQDRMFHGNSSWMWPTTPKQFT